MIKKIAIFGSTGSIGKNTIEVIKNDLARFEVVALTARSDYKTLAAQVNLLNPKFAVIEDEKKLSELKLLVNTRKTNLLAGREQILEIAKIKCDLVVSAIVGSAGMLPTLNAIRAGSNIALANKESLVCAGKFLMQEVKKHKVKMIPVDSEHNAIFQIFERKNLRAIENIILTASGGPFFNSDRDFSKITIKEALDHPNWKMGAKITIDSATMMNKGLEAIEAFHLFPVKKEQIKILVHPQSIIHGLVNYKDGSTLAMMSKPDMQVPIAYALSYPKRMAIKYSKLDLAETQNLSFFSADEKKFPALKLCREAMILDGNAPAILNAANEVAVEKFLQGKILFTDITKIVAKTLDKIPNKKLRSIEEVVEFDRIAREVSNNII